MATIFKRVIDEGHQTVPNLAMPRGAGPANGSGPRLASVDFVRGIAMILMALDHTRAFFTSARFEPENIKLTYATLFFARWVTHFCAPAFFLLAGLGAALYGRRHSDTQLRMFLLSRGLCLILLEFTIIGFAWTFKPRWGMFGVIWCLGASLLCLSAFVGLPRWMTGTVAILMIGLHNLFDRVGPLGVSGNPWLLFLLHRSGNIRIGHWQILVLFPLIPWVGVTLLGFASGKWVADYSEKRRRLLIWGGLGCVALFIALRLTNAYGNPSGDLAHSSPGAWTVQATAMKSAILFLYVEKYPPSLQYILMTIGPILLTLSLPAGVLESRVGRVVEVYGQTPLFFYILHLYVIHLSAVLVSCVTRQPTLWLLNGGFFLHDIPDGYGFNLEIVFIMWVLVVAALFYPCKWYANLKQSHPDSLLRYL